MYFLRLRGSRMFIENGNSESKNDPVRVVYFIGLKSNARVKMWAIEISI